MNLKLSCGPVPCWSGSVQTPNFTLGILLTNLFFKSLASMTSSINLQDCYICDKMSRVAGSHIFYMEKTMKSTFSTIRNTPFYPLWPNFYTDISARPVTFRNSENVTDYMLTVIMMTWLIRRVGPSWTIISVPDLVEQSTEGVRCQQVHYSKKAQSQLQILLSHNFHHSLQLDLTNP